MGVTVEVPSRVLELELAELICIEHSLSPSETFGSKSDGFQDRAPAKDMCLKVGAAILETQTHPEPVGVAFDEEELWILRERLSIYTSQGANADMGLVIKSKVYRALLDIANERSAAQLGIGDSAELDVYVKRQDIEDAVKQTKHPGEPDQES